MVAVCDLFRATAPEEVLAHLSEPMIQQLPGSGAAQFGLEPKLRLFCHTAQRLDADPRGAYLFRGTLG